MILDYDVHTGGHKEKQIYEAYHIFKKEMTEKKAHTLKQ